MPNLDDSGTEAEPVLTPARFIPRLAPDHARSSGAHGRASLMSAFAVPACEIETPPLTDHVIALHLAGAAPVTQRLGDRTLRRSLKRGALTIIPAFERTEWVLDGPVEFFHLYLPPAPLGQALAETGSARRPELQAPFAADDPLLAQILLALLEAYHASDPLAVLYTDALVNALTLHLLRRHTDAGSSLDRAPHCLPDAALAHVIDYVEANLERPLTLAELAAVARLSRFHFARTFRRAIGRTPHRYVQERRIVRARHLLAMGRLPIIEVAAACGFTNPGHFATTFKRLVAMSPRAYRQEARR
jgi:AraC family transcriptional regulator